MRPQTAIVRRFEVWPRCTCMVCLGLDHRHPDEGFQLAFWRYAPAPEPGPVVLRALSRHEVVKRNG